MRIFQLNHGLAYGGAIGTYMILLDEMLKREGYQTEILACSMDKRYPAGTARIVSPSADLQTKRGWPEFQEDDVVLFHMCHDTPLNQVFSQLSCKKVMIYHNITPPEFLRPFSEKEAARMERAYRDLDRMRPFVDGCLAISDYNARCLTDRGYDPLKIRALRGCFAPLDRYKVEPDKEILEKYRDGYVNLLFVGRVAPNKKFEDIIAQFAYYQKHINPRSRLFLVGNDTYPQYGEALRRYVRYLQVNNVVFPGHTSFEQLVAYYMASDVFVCMSEHEGFCVPLIEAMYFGLPVIAYAATAVPDTMGGAGVLLDSKDPALVAAWIDRLTQDAELRDVVMAGERERLKYFAPSAMETDFMEKLKSVME